MRYLNQQFCSVCKEAIIEKIHSLVSPVDSYTPANTSSVNANFNVTFTVNEILPIPNTLVNSWKLNGTQLASTASSLTVSPSQLNMGNNTLIFSVNDNSPMLKVNNHNTVHFTNITWTLNKSSARKMTEVKAEERRYSVYPNPSDGEFFIKGKQDFAKNTRVELFDVSGKLIPVKLELKDHSTLLVDIKNLPAGNYLVNVYEDEGMIISQKIIKQ